MMPSLRSIVRAAVAASALLLSGRPAFAAGRRDAPPRADSLRVVAVMPLGVDGRDTLLTPLGFCLADLLAIDLARSQHLTLVERTRLAVVLRELSLAERGVVDSATAPRTGHLLRARTVITGALGRRANDLVVFTIALRDVGTGQVDRASEARAPLGAVLDAEKSLAFELFDRLGVQLTPTERALVEARPTRSLAALVAYGQGVQAEVNGQYAAAARAFRRAAAADPAFREAHRRAADVRAEAGRAATAGASQAATAAVNAALPTVPATVRPSPAIEPAYPTGASTITVKITRP